MSSSQVQCDLKNTPRDIVAAVKSHAVLPWLGAWGVTGSGHRWYILKSYAPDNIRAFYMRCWTVKVHIVTWKRCNLSEYNWAFHSKCMGQSSCFANLEINRINPHLTFFILQRSKVESKLAHCRVLATPNNNIAYFICILWPPVGLHSSLPLQWKMFKHVQFFIRNNAVRTVANAVFQLIDSQTGTWALIMFW